MSTVLADSEYEMSYDHQMVLDVIGPKSVLVPYVDELAKKVETANHYFYNEFEYVDWVVNTKLRELYRYSIELVGSYLRDHPVCAKHAYQFVWTNNSHFVFSPLPDHESYPALLEDVRQLVARDMAEKIICGSKALAFDLKRYAAILDALDHKLPGVYREIYDECWLTLDDDDFDDEFEEDVLEARLERRHDIGVL